MEAVSSTAKSGSLPVVCDRPPGAVTRACEGRVSTSTKSSSAPLGARNFPRHETNDAGFCEARSGQMIADAVHTAQPEADAPLSANAFMRRQP